MGVVIVLEPIVLKLRELGKCEFAEMPFDDSS